jgi:hypothetical protein
MDSGSSQKSLLENNYINGLLNTVVSTMHSMLVAPYSPVSSGCSSTSSLNDFMDSSKVHSNVESQPVTIQNNLKYVDPSSMSLVSSGIPSSTSIARLSELPTADIENISLQMPDMRMNFRMVLSPPTNLNRLGIFFIILCNFVIIM